VDDVAVARELFQAAADWLRPRGLETLRGPVSFSTNDEAGLLVQGFDTPPVILMPHHPPYYARLFEACGFAKAKDLLAYQSTHDRLPERLVRGTELLQRRYGVTTRRLDMRRFAAEVDAVRRLYNRAWERNWGFVPLSDREIDHLAAQLRPIVVPDLVVFAERAGETIGFAAAVPDLNVALRANPSGRLFPGLLRVLWAARKTSRLRVLMLGTVPDWRGRGVDALLYREIWEKGLARGYRWAEAGWVLEDNHPMRNGLEHMGFEVYKTYRLYDRVL
jgi:GNAT superfamily N-acetyltransferase